MFSLRPTVLAFLALGLIPAGAAPRPFEEMDYGRFFSATYNNAQGKTTFDHKGCAANKGIAIRLGAEGNASVLFDTDLVRLAGGWTGGFIKLKGVAFDGAHGPNPQPIDGAQMVCETNPTGPGWSKGGSFEDPRKLPTGPGAATIPFGPLPADWAKYQGLYQHGDEVVLAYTVGAASVLELDGVETVDGVAFLTRSFQVLTPGAASDLALADLPETEAAIPAEGLLLAAGDVKDADGLTLAIAGAGLPAGAEVSLLGNRAALKLPAFKGGETFKIELAKVKKSDLPATAAALKKAAQPTALEPLTHGGAPHWTETVSVQGVLGQATENAPYVVDTLTLPTLNPYKSWMRVGAIDFFPDGRLAFSTWSGDVWIGSGIDDKLEKITWRRFATGLFQPLGLKIVNNEIYVLGRDQITRLHDLNGDGEADFYECFNNEVQVTPGFHEFAFDLQTDPQGNFYFAKGGPVNPGGRGWGPLSDHNGCLFKVSKDGKKFQVFATGLRAPNGIGVNPWTGEVTTGDNQGTWVPVDYIHYVKEGDFVEVPDLAHRPEPPKEYPAHLCWVPYDQDNSCGGHVWVTSDKWGPLKGQMLYLSYGKSALFSVLKEKVGDILQGGVVKFPLKFDSGIMRARFNPVDGQLYVAGLRGWQTNGAKDGAIQRVRYTGKPVTIQTSLRITDHGIHIGFSSPLDTASASDPENYSIVQYNYKWAKDYGSPEFKLSNPTQKGRDSVEIKSVTVAPNRREVFLEVPDLQPVMQMRIKMNIKAENGESVPAEIGNTINVVPKES